MGLTGQANLLGEVQAGETVSKLKVNSSRDIFWLSYTAIHTRTSKNYLEMHRAADATANTLGSKSG